MQALTWNGQSLRLDPSYPTPEAGERTALVRVRLAGICSTDLQIFKSYMGFQGVPGHEFVGEVKEGPVELVGKRVVGEINFACGRCDFCAQVLRLTGARVSAVGKHESKLALLKKLGIRALLLSDWKPRQADVVVEATGSTSGLKMALDLVRPRGTLVLKSTVAHEHALNLAPLVINEVTVIGSRCGLFPPALDALAQKKVAVTSMIEKVYPLTAGIDAVGHAARPGTRKILLRP